jgi:hypothetical protein
MPTSVTARRFPPPWTVEESEKTSRACFIVLNRVRQRRPTGRLPHARITQYQTRTAGLALLFVFGTNNGRN